MQFQVPQNIDLEDKIIGPLTLKQFIILLIGGMFDYMWYTFLGTGLFILLAIPTTVITLALVFAKVHEEPFPKFLANLILFALKPRVLTWGKTPKPKIIEVKKAKKEKFLPKTTSGSDIERLARVIDTQGWSGAETQPLPKPKIPAVIKLSPIPKPKPQPKPFIEKFIKKDKTKTAKLKPEKIQKIQPKISQPQPIKAAVTEEVAPLQKPPKPIIKANDIKKIARQVAKEEKASTKKVRKAAEEIAKKLKTTPLEKIKSKKPFWKKIIDKLPKIPQVKPGSEAKAAPTEKETPPKEHILATEILTPEDMERELGLGGRVKSHQAVKPKLNLGPASENVAEDPFDKVEP